MRKLQLIEPVMAKAKCGYQTLLEPYSECDARPPPDNMATSHMT